MIQRLAPAAKDLRSVAILFSGGVLAQLIPLAASPVLGRLFSPVEFGALTAFLAVASIATMLATGRYELAIIPAASDQSAAALLRVAIGLALVISVAGSVLLGFLNTAFGVWETYSYLLPLSIFLLAAERTYNSWLSRKSAFRQLSLNRLLQGVATVAAQIGSGLLGVGVWGLLGGQLLGQLSACMMARWSAQASLPAGRHLSRPGVLANVASDNRNYPLYMIPAGLAHEGATQLPLLIFAASYGTETLGYLAIAQRLMMAPVSLTATAVGDVFRAKAAAAYRESGQCLDLLLRYLGLVAVGGLIVILPVVFFGKALFSTVFGTQWGYAGELARTLTILTYAQLISFPFSQTLLLAGLQHLDFIWNVARLMANILSLASCIWMDWDFERTLLVYCCTNAALYLIYLCIQVHASRGRPSASVHERTV